MAIRTGVDRGLIRVWRDAENAYFGAAVAEPGMYEVALRLVRGLADGLRDVGSEEELERTYDERDVDWAEERIRGLDLARGDWRDPEAARDAAFNLRLAELRAEEAARGTAGRLARARAAGETWLVAVDGSTGMTGWRTYRRVDIHTSAGIALYGYTERDWERGETCWLEVLRVDPDTGAGLHGSTPIWGPRAYRDRAALERAFTSARRRYAGA